VRGLVIWEATSKTASSLGGLNVIFLNFFFTFFFNLFILFYFEIKMTSF
jgi:hypothetical protein